MIDLRLKLSSDLTQPIAARVWGWAGVIPFSVLALLNFFVEEIRDIDVDAAFISYGAIILAFMGGIQWGLTMTSGHDDGEQSFRYTVSIVPVLFAFCAMVTRPALAHFILAAGFFLLLLYDIQIVRKFRALGWYPRLRLPLTTTVLACIAINGMNL